ncbi:phosphatidylglycerol:prolipoprotein diacylglycerol transferase [Proteiniborus ethanoligenes]|uniref:Phosphatidylglycerol--prolipoprotein diacylglyceryl transferase n=1 Tax=Proteiniborus ethanoligenes TaxID=415015 RepID=A0A1H3JX03_9FIRM|nr:prolipoprotein diacylglyceryl transferase [Proteiniborus ethanoligenes]TAH63716.1 MAG: prolipoprotein diacylglyceryl transferase [Gottschalkiaceae bacterium]SDY43878.1 phosphatidylglycerol:prolipoprotein diacylglycerol transferase [Proteiniborus ethanoligenes]
MDPVAFEIFNIEVRWYGIIISFGLLMAALVAMREAKRIGIREEDILDLLIFAVPSAIIGARLYYVIFTWEQYQGDLMKIINIREGGLAIHGALIASIIVGIIFCRVKKIYFWKLADLAGPSIILGQAIGRWGNYVNREAHGGPTDLPWGIIIEGQKVHPTFLYESLWNFAVFIFLLWYKKRKKAHGEVFLLYLSLYSLGRFFIEGLRTDSLMYGPFRVAQLISIITIVLSLAMFAIIRKKFPLERDEI